MTPHDLIAAFDAVAESPDGVARLRELLFELAVRGKLVPTVNGEWPTVMLAELVDEFQNGTASRGGEGGPPVVVLRLADIKQGRIVSTSFRQIDLSADSARKYCVREGDVLAIRVNGSADLVGRLIVVERSQGWCYCDHLIRIRLRPNTLLPQFLRLFGETREAREHLSSVTVTTAGQKTVNQKGLGFLRVPLPTVPEQHRIVDCVDELTGLLDRLEAARTTRESARAAVRDAILASLREAETADEVEIAWTRFAERMDQLMCYPSDIAPLRQTILQLAVRGKIVPQDAGDEPAGSLMKRIRDSGVASRGNHAAAGEGTDVRWELPGSWCWVRLSDIANFSIGRTPPTKDPTFWTDVGGHAWVSIADMEHYGEVATTKRRVSAKAASEVFRSPPMAKGTILMSFKLTIGKVARLAVEAYHNEAIVSVFPAVGGMDGYLFRFLPLFASGVETNAAIKGQTLNSTSLTNLLIPLPPLAEQHRIVRRVDELMCLFDRLEERLADARAVHIAFAAAAIHHLDV